MLEAIDLPFAIWRPLVYDTLGTELRIRCIQQATVIELCQADLEEGEQAKAETNVGYGDLHH